jgi:hypothetical protein
MSVVPFKDMGHTLFIDSQIPPQTFCGWKPAVKFDGQSRTGLDAWNFNAAKPHACIGMAGDGVLICKISDI